MEQKFFEDIYVADKDKTSGRTITEADIVNFAGLSGDFNPIHIDKQFAEKTFYKKRIAHGILVFSVASGLFTQCAMNLSMKQNVIALMQINWKFIKPVFIGDTIHLEVEVVEKKETSKTDRGIILIKRAVANQTNEVVQHGDVTMMIRRKQQ